MPIIKGIRRLVHRWSLYFAQAHCLPGPHTTSFIKFLKLKREIVMTSLYTSLEHSEKDQGGKAGLYISRSSSARQFGEVWYHYEGAWVRKARRLCSLEKAPVNLGVWETPKTPTKIWELMPIGSKKMKPMPRKKTSQLLWDNRSEYSESRVIWKTSDVCDVMRIVTAN